MSTLVSSSFDPAGQSFSSVVPSLDLHKVQVHEVSNQNSAEVILDKGVTAQSLWCGNLSTTAGSNSNSKQRKKRKRSSMVKEAGAAGANMADLVVAVGTNKGSIIVFSPAQSSIVASLEGAHSVPVSSVACVQDNLWSCDRNGTIAQWNVDGTKAINVFQSPEKNVHLVQPLPSSPEFANQVLVASTSVHLVDTVQKSVVKSFPGGFAHPVSLIRLSNTNPDLFLAASNSERNISVISISQGKVISILTALSEVQSVALSADDSCLAVTTEDGTVELFADPFKANASASPNKNSAKAKAKAAAMASKSVLQFKLFRPSTGPSKKGGAVIKGSQVFIEGVSLDEGHFTVSWLENAIVPVFEKFPYRSEDNGQILNDTIVVERAPRTNAGVKDLNGVDPAAVSKYNEGNATVTSGKNLKNVEVEEDEEDEEEESTLADQLNALDVANGTAKGSSRSEVDDVNGSAVKPLEFSTPGTFTTILNQALRTNDNALLDSCLVHRDVEMIKLSVQKLDSALAVRLLERLAEKIARSPNQAGPLNVWIKWVMIAHGGYLVTIPDLVKTLSSLHSTLSDRVSTLPRLLALQGRLQMLNSQMEFRRDVLTSRRQVDDEDDEEEDEEEVEYVEDGAYIANGEEEDDFEDSDEDEEEDEEDSDVDGGQSFISLEAEEDDDDEEEEDASDLEVGEPMSEDEDVLPRSNGKARK
uniref:ARAD1A14014p n=1 Tax=Blastobotrys adeninivorans TaxID=409370 RepID=A0A060SXM3_BLAAD